MHLCLIEFNFIEILAINSMCKVFLEGLGGWGMVSVAFGGFWWGPCGGGWGLFLWGGLGFVSLAVFCVIVLM